MRALANTEVLELWEQTRGQKPLRQALAWLRCASPELSSEEWGALPVGHVCRALFQLRAAMFGRKMPAVARCPKCDEQVEFTFECEAMLPQLPDCGTAETTLQMNGEELRLRLPSANDLLAASSAAALLERCALSPVHEPASWLVKASEWVAATDPASETAVELTCPTCRQIWEAPLDIASYLSAELANLARRLLREVHRLATAYGWSERDILSISPVRRAAYLEMAGV